MKRLRIFLLGFAVFSLCTPLAQAQDYYESDGGLYWSVRGGLSQLRQKEWFIWPAVDMGTYQVNAHNEYRNIEMDYGFVAGASIGYTALYPESSADLRFELEGIYRRNNDGSAHSEWWPIDPDPAAISIGQSNAVIEGSVEVRSAMFNFLVDFHTPSRITPYIGLGAGISQIVIDAELFDIGRALYGYPYPIVIDETLYALSWQAIAGVGYHLSPGTLLTLEFRYFRLAADRYSEFFRNEELADVKFDDWSMGVRFTF